MKLINTSQEIANILGIKVCEDLPLSNFCIDSRMVKKNSVFFGLKGLNQDGGKFAKDAVNAGAALVIASEKSKHAIDSPRIHYIKDPVAALTKLSTVAIKKYEGYVIGVTGSNGKTTVKNILHAGIKQSFATPGNFNNELGLPLSVMSLKQSQKYAIFEMGAGKKGDIEFLAKLINPNIGIITHIGHSHLQGLNSVLGVLKVKSELIHQIRSGGAAIIPDGKYVKHWKALRDDIEFHTFGSSSSASFYPSQIKITKQGTSFFINSKHLKHKISVFTPLLGIHNIHNILAAFAVIYQAKLSIEFFCKSLSIFENSAQRLSLQSWFQGSMLIDDSYNANPDSFKAAIDVLDQFTGRKILIMGDMLDLGRYRKKFHTQIGEYAKMHGVDILLGIGDLTKHSVKSFGLKGYFFKSKEDLKYFLECNISEKDTLLLKGSRGMKMEQILTLLESKND